MAIPPDPTNYSRSPESPDRMSRQSEVVRDILESVLEHTAEASADDDGLDPVQRQALAEVARRYRGQPLVPVPVLSELVQAMLVAEFRDRPEWCSAWGAVAGRVAQTLWDDAISRQRLEVLWSRLTEG